MNILETKSYNVAVNAKGDPSATKVAILMPGRLDTKDYANFVSHIEFLSNLGFYAIAIDVPGTWDSPGDVEDYTTSKYLKVTNELIDVLGNRQTLLLGHSRGGATAQLASHNPAVVGLVLINSAYGTPTSPDPKKIVNGALIESRDVPPGNTRTKEQRLFNLPLAYFEDGSKHNIIGSLLDFKGPKLVVHATRDEFEPLENVKSIYESLIEPKMFLEIDCTHDYRLYPEIVKSVETTLGVFIQKYMP